MPRIAIHGFGRIGRTLMRAALTRGLFAPFGVSDIADPEALAALLRVDSTYGRWHECVAWDHGCFRVGSHTVEFFNAAAGLPNWGDHDVELVIDCTGNATRRSGAEAHLDRGAKRVLVSAASKSKEEADVFLLPGINLEQFDPQRNRIVSMGSCTANALAPMVKVLLDTCGIESGLFTTVHAYTNTQALTDAPRTARRDSWAATENIIPSSSGAARALQYIWPGLDITGKAYRVPVPTGSIVELTALSKSSTTEEAIRNAFRAAAGSPPLSGILDVLEEEWASSRIVGDHHSSIVDLPLVKVMGDRLLTVAAWYDNELGYATRLAETANLLSRS